MQQGDVQRGALVVVSLVWVGQLRLGGLGRVLRQHIVLQQAAKETGTGRISGAAGGQQVRQWRQWRRRAHQAAQHAGIRGLRSVWRRRQQMPDELGVASLGGIVQRAAAQVRG